MQEQGLMLRRGVQLHWRNDGYADFEDYLAGMRATNARRSIRKGAR